MILKKVGAEDRDTYIALADEFYSSAAVLHKIPEENFGRTFETVVASSPYARLFLLMNGSVAVGYLLTAETYSQEAGGKVIWIEEIYVSPKFRGNGIGKTAIEELKILAQKEGVKRIRLEYEPSNADAVRLYEKLGFADFGYKQMVIENN